MKDLLSCEGRRFRCKIDGTLATGIIRVVDGYVYLCQNEKNGSHSIDKKGYKYAWCVYSGTEADFAHPNVRVTDFRFIPITAEEIEAYKDWQVGDRLRKKRRIIPNYRSYLPLRRTHSGQIYRYKESIN